MHIGLVGGIDTVLDLTIVHADVREMARNLASNAAQTQAETFAHLIIGTRNVTESGLYCGITSARIVRPESDALDDAHNTHVTMAIAGHVTDMQRQVFFSVEQHLSQAQGAEAIVLGGTDLFLAFAGQDCGLPVRRHSC